MKTPLDDILAPVTGIHFLDSIWQASFAFGTPVPGRYRKLWDWDALNKILTEQRIAPNRLKLVRNGRPVDATSFQYRQFLLRTDGLIRELQEGATLVLDSVDEAHRPLRDLSREFRACLRAPVHVNLYAGWKRDRGFNVHFDIQENLILQTHGRKLWKIWRPTKANVICPEVLEPGREPDSPLEWEGMLEDGAWLYIPRGWWHVANPVDEPTMHLTMTICPLRLVDFLIWSVELASKSTVAGQYIPMDDNDEMLCLRILESELSSRFTHQFVERFVGEKLNDCSVYPELKLPILGPPTTRPAEMPGSQDRAAESHFTAPVLFKSE